MNEYQEQLLALMKVEDSLVKLRDRAIVRNDLVAYKYWCRRLESLYSLMEQIREEYMEGK